MKLSKRTVSILKNFSKINQGIYFNPGSLIKTISPSQSILAVSEIEENIPVEFGIYDLNNFISVLSLHDDDVTFDFDHANILIKGYNDRSIIKYRFCAENMIVLPPDIDYDSFLEDCQISFKLTEEDFSWINKTASLLSSPHVAVSSESGSMDIVCTDMNDDSAHTNSVSIGASDLEYRMVFRSENIFKVLPGEYQVDIKVTDRGAFSRFTSSDGLIKYYIALENLSTFG